jgi:uncharacterized protein
MTDAGRNKQIIRAAFEAMANADPTLLIAAMSDDLVWIIEGRSAWSRRFEGRETIERDLVAPLFARFATPYRNYLDQIIAEDDSVVVRARGEVRTKTGKDYNNSYCFVIRMRDGKMVELREYMDTALAESALGRPGT